jgi:hypothetical protein
MVKKPISKHKWSIKENVILKASEYKTHSDWFLNNRASYKSAIINDWFDECINIINLVKAII